MKEWITPIGVIATIAFLSWFIWDDLKDLRSDVHSIEVRLAVVETDVAHLKEDVAEIKDDIKSIKEILESMQSTRAAHSKSLPEPARTSYGQ
jgi:predicted  nucleic acid-binding Zn-ribbon protein